MLPQSRALNLGKYRLSVDDSTNTTRSLPHKSNPRYSTMGIAEDTPRQLAPSVGRGSAGFTASPVSSSGGHSTTSPSHGNSPIASPNGGSPIITSDGNSPIPSTGANSKSEHSPISPRRLKPHSIEAQQAFEIGRAHV